MHVHFGLADFISLYSWRSLGHLQTSNWSNNTLASLPPLGSRRRVKSADATKFGLDYIPTLSSKLMITPANSLDAGNNFQTPRRLWLPNLNNQNTSTLNNPPVTEFGTSHLIGQAIEPLGTMLYTRGRVKLGTYVWLDQWHEVSRSTGFCSTPYSWASHEQNYC